MKRDNNTQDAQREYVADDNGFMGGEAYPNCDGEPCDNVAGDGQEAGQEPVKMAEELALWRDKYVRLQAEFDNYRKRTLKEKMELMLSAGEDVIKALLPVIDDMDRALEAMKTSKDVEAVKEGIMLISNKLRDTLRNRGVTEIEAVGQALDTDFHEAIAKIPAGKGDRGKIVDVVQKGYKLNDKVIRHCKVVVGE